LWATTQVRRRRRFIVVTSADSALPADLIARDPPLSGAGRLRARLAASGGATTRGTLMHTWTGTFEHNQATPRVRP